MLTWLQYAIIVVICLIAHVVDSQIHQAKSALVSCMNRRVGPADRFFRLAKVRLNASAC